MKAKDWIAILQSMDENEEVIGALWTRDLFGDGNVLDASGEHEYEQCPQSAWDAVADTYEFRDHINEEVYDDIRLSLQEEIDRQQLKGGE